MDSNTTCIQYNTIRRPTHGEWKDENGQTICICLRMPAHVVGLRLTYKQLLYIQDTCWST